MVNVLWVVMIVAGLLAAFLTGKAETVTQSVLDSVQYAVELCFGLIGIYALWLGLMKVAEDAGLVKAISRRIGGIMKLLFPHISPQHPAMGSITMNIIANMLGMGNAATPFGIKAMKQMQELNRNKDVASNAMCMFLVINTSSVQLIPATVIAIRSAAGSKNPAEIVGTALLATTCSTAAGIMAAKLFERYGRIKGRIGGK